MKKKKMFVLLLLGGLIFSQAYAEKDNTIKLVNDKVAQIEQGIKEEKFSLMNIEYVMDAREVHAIGIKFYFIFNFEKDTFSLVCVKFEMPMEIYSNEYSYFFDDNEKLIKFNKKTINRPDNPPKQGKIYDEFGRIAWSNFNYELPIDTEELKCIFKEFNEKLIKTTHKHAKFM